MSQPAKDELVRVRLYGLVSLTKGRYLLQLAVAVVLAAGLLALWWFRWPEVRRALLAAQSPVMDKAVAFGDAAPWVIGAPAVLQAVEAFFVLRAFRRKEEEKKLTAEAPRVGEVKAGGGEAAPEVPPAPEGPAYPTPKPPEGG
jgi:hypothetical protein